MTFIRIVCLTGLMLVLSANSFAQSKKELAAQDEILSQRISVLESRMLTGDPAADRLMQRMDALESSQRNLTGEVERLRFERDNLRAEVAALSEDIRLLQELATRTQIHLDAVDLVAKEQASRNPYPPTPFPNQTYTSQPYQDPSLTGSTDYAYDDLAGESTTLSGVPSAPEFKEMTIPIEQNYQSLSNLPAEGKRKLSEGDFLGAQGDFVTYLTAIPDADDAGEVNYWLGETYYVTGSYADAADAYITSMRKDGQGIKAPDAMIRLAGALRQLGKKSEACQTLDSFPTQFPGASSDLREKRRTELARAGC